MGPKETILSLIDQKKELYFEISDSIWEYAETRFEEYKSAELLCDVLSKEGFAVQKNLADMETAFVASYGKGEPVIGILGEYDALSGLSQKGGQTKKEAIKEGGNGHGCGHHILGTAGLAAVLALKEYMQQNKMAGTIRYFGCPGEEGGSGKAYMARAGLFDDVDAALTWHPSSVNSIWSTSSLANYQVYFKFHGVASHAAGSPHMGRSALDAVELMNVGVQYLREHIIPEARVHYAVLNTGGRSPNVVQAEAETLYLIRAPKNQQVQEIYEWVCEIAKGAAMMTRTTCEIVFDKGCSNVIPNRTLEKVLFEKLTELGPVQFNADEIHFAEEIRQTLTPEQKRGNWQQYGKQAKEIAKALEDKAVADITMPYIPRDEAMPGSTDVGDVSWNVPTAQFTTACQALGTPGHSWQSVAQGTTGLSHKGMLQAGKVLALAALELFNNPKIIDKAKEELREEVGEEGYICPIPADVKPAAVR